jgi:Uma2 family endonuclease
MMRFATVKMENESKIPAYLQDIYPMLKCAFPDGVLQSDYIALLAIVHGSMSFRRIAEALSVLTGKDYSVVYNDASGFRIGETRYPLEPDTLDRVREKLILCGFESWLEAGRSDYNGILAENVEYTDYLDGRFGKFVEWVDGKVMAMPQPTLKELRLRWFLRSFFDIYLDATSGAKAFSDPFTMKIGANLPARQPDDYVILPDRLHLLTERALEGAANLVVEIVTPECEYVDHVIKYAEYEKGGVQEYWILDPARKEPLFYVLGEDGLFHSRLPVAGVYTSMVLPKLKLAISLLWEESYPGPIEVVEMVKQMLAEA